MEAGHARLNHTHLPSMFLCKLAGPPHPKTKTWHSQMDRVCSESREARPPGGWSPGPFLCLQRTQDSALTVELCSQHLGNIRMLEQLLEMLPPAFLAHLNILKLTQIWKSVFAEYLPFPLWWLLLVILSDKRTLCKILGNTAAALCLILALLYHGSGIPFHPTKTYPQNINSHHMYRWITSRGEEKNLIWKLIHFTQAHRQKGSQATPSLWP